MYTYFLINLFTIIGPLAGSFEPRVNFKSKWIFAIPATVIMAIPFLIWDALFTKRGVWGFNPDYYLGITIAGLPIEEWLFFLTVPFACVLIYETVVTLHPSKFSKVANVAGTLLGVMLISLGIIYSDQLYTLVAFTAAGIFLIVHGLLLRTNYFHNFLIAYAIHLIPFFIVNGILTALPVVWYNDTENFGLRIGTIPIEDAVYSLLLLLGNITIFEMLRNRSVQNLPKNK